jgi:hypothetical protein
VWGRLVESSWTLFGDYHLHQHSHEHDNIAPTKSQETCDFCVKSQSRSA